MSLLALNPAQQPSSQCAFELAAGGGKTDVTGRDIRFLPGDWSGSSEVGVPAQWHTGNQWEDVQMCVSNYEFPFMLGHGFGAKPAPCGSASFCFALSAPSGSRFLPKQV